MKEMNLTGRIVLGTMQMFSIGLGILTLSAIVYAAFQICTGNYHSTASFEF